MDANNGRPVRIWFDGTPSAAPVDTSHLIDAEHTMTLKLDAGYDVLQVGGDLGMCWDPDAEDGISDEFYVDVTYVLRNGLQVHAVLNSRLDGLPTYNIQDDDDLETYLMALWFGRLRDAVRETMEGNDDA